MFPRFPDSLGKNLAGKAHHVARFGAVSVRIHRQKTHSGVVFVVSEPLAGGGRRRKSFAVEAEAKAFAGRLARTLSERGSAVSTLSPDENAALALLRSTAGPLGITLRTAILDAEAAIGILKGQATLRSAAEAVAKTGAGTNLKAGAISIAQAVESFLEAKRKSGRSTRHLQDLSSRLSRVSRECLASVADISPQMIRGWIEGIPGIEGRSRNNYLAAWSALVGHCVREGWILPGSCDVARIDRWTVASGEIAIFTPEELGRLFAGAGPEMRPWIGLGAWAGLRTAELGRLRWKDIRFDAEADAPHGYVDVPADITKNAAKLRGRARRLVPLTENLRRLLLDHRPEDPSTRLCTFQSPNHQLLKAARKAGVEWKDNGLRHSFGSYRMAIVKNEHTVAMEMGNTPAMVFAHYRRLVNNSLATEWFAVDP
jgi:integrase